LPTSWPNLRAPTPSAAAELLSPDQNEMLQTLQGFALVFRKLIGDRLQRDTRQLLWLTRQLKHPGRRLQEHAQALDMLEGRLLRATRHHLAHTANALQRLQQRLSLYSPAAAIRQQQLRQEALRHRLERAMQQTLQRQQASLAQLARSLDGVSPLQTLRRGYSITYVEQQVVRSTADLQVGQTLRTQLGAGAVLSTVSALLPKAQINES
jgi:exodeoxyribonuclease VII large subunit